jgi:ligand-binding SRPBCC domain-containing protein
VEGRFQRFVHDHFFEAQGSGTVMRDVLEFEAPFGWVGRVAESLFLKGAPHSLAHAAQCRYQMRSRACLKAVTAGAKGHESRLMRSYSFRNE